MKMRVAALGRDKGAIPSVAKDCCEVSFMARYY
jgi:hypothetical protein